MNNKFLEKLEDNLNPLLFRDLRKAIKSKEFLFKFIFLVLVYISLYFVIILNISKSSDYILICYKVLAFIFLEVFVVIPNEIHSSSLNDFINDNLHFVFMSNITAEKYIKAKLSLGLIYSSIILISAIPIYLIIFFTGAINFYRLIGIFYYSCIFLLPFYLFTILETVNDSKASKLSIYIGGILNTASLMFFGYWIIQLGIVEGIRDVDPHKITGIVIANTIILLIIMAFSIFVHLFLYTTITKLYPMSEIDSSNIRRIRRGFSLKIKKVAATKSINSAIDSDFLNVTDSKAKTNSLNNKGSNIETESSIVLDSKHEAKPLNTLTQYNKQEQIFSDNDSPQTNLKQLYGKSLTQRKTSSETLIKNIITMLWVIGLIFILPKSSIGYFIVRSFFLVFIYLCVYCHSRDTIYDKRNRLEIPAPGFGRIIKFPFVSGYINGIVWLTILSLSFMITIFLTYGNFDIKSGIPYRTIDVLPQSYSVYIAFMLNISSWCFIGRFIADIFFNNKDNKSNSVLSVTITLLLLASISNVVLPTDSNSLNILNYFVPLMPAWKEYFFFNDHLALICNFIFFIITIIPNLKTMHKQAKSYFS